MKNRNSTVHEQPIIHRAFESVKFCGKERPRWYADVVDRVLAYGNSEAGKQAKSEGWWGCIYENGNIAPFGLAAYFAETTAIQYWAVYGLQEPRPMFEVDELRFDADFQAWIRSKHSHQEIFSRGIIDILLRVRDLEKIKSKH